MALLTILLAGYGIRDEKCVSDLINNQIKETWFQHVYALNNMMTFNKKTSILLCFSMFLGICHVHPIIFVSLFSVFSIVSLIFTGYEISIRSILGKLFNKQIV